MEGWVYALMAVICWGVEALLVRAAKDGVDPLTGTAVGCIAAGGVFLLYLAGTGRLNSGVVSQSGLYYALAGLVSFALGHFLYYTAINKAGVSISVSLVATYPLLTVLLAWIFFGEALTLKSLIGVVLIIVGGMLVVA